MLLRVVDVAHLRPREPDQLPSHHVRIPAMLRIAEHALDGVLAEQREKTALLDGPELCVLLGRREIVEPGEKVHSRGVAYTPKRGGRIVVHHR